MEYKLHKISRKGNMHKENNEDAGISLQRNEILLNAVFDGCSSGETSHFASMLFAKALKNVFYSFNIENKAKITDLLKNIVRLLIEKLNSVKKILVLNTPELLSTAIISVTDLKSKESEIVVIGDGFVSVNGQHTEIDQNNTPNYLAYHLENLENSANFDQWYETENRVFHISETEKLTIATDGIFSFKKIENKPQTTTPDTISFLIDNNFLLKNKAMLARKLNILKNKHYLENEDDISIIRLEF